MFRNKKVEICNKTKRPTQSESRALVGQSSPELLLLQNKRESVDSGEWRSRANPGPVVLKRIRSTKTSAAVYALR